jgi:periplasmic protein TonB
MKNLYQLLFCIILMCAFTSANCQVEKIVDGHEVESSVFEKVEVEASFPGGAQAWSTYITKNITAHIDELKKKDVGTCIIRFIVDVDGRTSDVHATNMKKTLLAKIAIEAIENGPKWIPAVQNGKPVKAYRLQPITLLSPK